MKHLIRYGVVLGIMLSLGLPFIVQAQEGGGLSAEEVALVERIVGVEDLLASYSSYYANRWDSESSSISLGEDVAVNISSLRREGYTLNDGETSSTQFRAFFSNDVEPFYVMEGNVIQIDAIAYVEATYHVTAEEGAPVPDIEVFPDFPEGWQVMESEEDIPADFEDLKIDQLFDDEPPIFFDQEPLMMYATSVTSEEVTITLGDAEVVVEQLTLIVDGDNFLPFYTSTLDEDALANPIVQALFSEGLTGSMTVTVQFLENGDVYQLTGSANVSHLDIDAYAANPDFFNEGDTLGLEGNFYTEVIYSDINGDFEPIEAPQLG